MPMPPHNMVGVLTLQEWDGEIFCETEFLLKYNWKGENLIVSWNSTQCPDGYQSLGDGVVFIRINSEHYNDFETYKSNSRPDSLGNGEYVWDQGGYADNRMIVLVLPAGFTITSVEHCDPVPFRFKLFNGKLAFFWELGRRDRRIRWRMRKLEETEQLRVLSEHFNRIVLENGNARPLEPPSPHGRAVGYIQTDIDEDRPMRSILVFYSYSHKDERFRAKLEEHLSLLQRQGIIAGWHDRKIGAGQEWKGAIDKNLEEAHVVLLLVSASFLASVYCWDVETRRAVERHERGESWVIPVILRPCDWHGAPFAKLQALPKDAKPVTSWANRDEAWTDVARGIRRAVEAMTADPWSLRE